MSASNLCSCDAETPQSQIPEVSKSFRWHGYVDAGAEGLSQYVHVTDGRRKHSLSLIVVYASDRLCTQGATVLLGTDALYFLPQWPHAASLFPTANEDQG